MKAQYTVGIFLLFIHWRMLALDRFNSFFLSWQINYDLDVQLIMVCV
jgi:hypothetical protein